MEFKKAQKDLEEIGERLLRYDVVFSGDKNGDFGALVEVEAGMAEMREKVAWLCEVGEKMVSKMDKNDPVTGEARFGPTMVQKIKDYSLRVESVREQITERGAVCNSLLQTAREQEEAKARAKRQKDLEDYIAREAEEEIRESLQKEEDEREKARLAQEAAAAAAISAQASSIRDKKASAAADEVQRREEAFKALTRTVAQHNALPKSMGAFEAALSVMSESGDASAVGAATATLADILGNIMSKPDQDTFRRLKTDSQVLRQRLLDVKGGLDALMACGFHAVIEKPETYPTDPATVLLTMSEPNPEADISAWMGWFDGLKERKELVDKKANS